MPKVGLELCIIDVGAQNLNEWTFHSLRYRTEFLSMGKWFFNNIKKSTSTYETNYKKKVLKKPINFRQKLAFWNFWSDFSEKYFPRPKILSWNDTP